jgi:hypothetical protein
VTDTVPVLTPFDYTVIGDVTQWKLLCQESSESEGWSRETKAIDIPGIGALVQVTTRQIYFNGTSAVAQALAFVPGVKVVDDGSGGARLGV